MTIKPLDDRVLVKPMPEEEKTASGIIIPDTAKVKSQIAEVVAVGTDEDLAEIVKTGMKVMYGKYSGEDISIDNEEHKLLSRSDILAIVED